MTLKAQEKNAKASVEKWNNKYSVGQKVTVKKDSGELIKTKTKSEAYVMSCTAVILLEDINGCYCLDRVKADE